MSDIPRPELAWKRSMSVPCLLELGHAAHTGDPPGRCTASCRPEETVSSCSIRAEQWFGPGKPAGRSAALLREQKGRLFGTASVRRPPVTRAGDALCRRLLCRGCRPPLPSGLNVSERVWHPQDKSVHSGILSETCRVGRVPRGHLA